MVINHINTLNDKNHVVIPIVAEKVIKFIHSLCELLTEAALKQKKTITSG